MPVLPVRRQKGVAGAQLWLLHHKSETWMPREAMLDSGSLVADHDDRGLGLQGSRRCQRVLDHRPAGNLVKHFGPRRFHARTLPRCEDDDVQVQGP